MGIVAAAMRERGFVVRGRTVAVRRTRRVSGVASSMLGVVGGGIFGSCCAVEGELVP